MKVIRDWRKETGGKIRKTPTPLGRVNDGELAAFVKYAFVEKRLPGAREGGGGEVEHVTRVRQCVC